MKILHTVRPYETELIERDEALSDGTAFAKVRLTVAGLCEPEAQIFSGEQKLSSPVALARHGVGVISEIEDNLFGLKRGDRVVIRPQLPCESCYSCKMGEPNLCRNLKVMGISSDGFLCDFKNVPLDNLYALPDKVDDRRAVFTETVAFALSILDEINTNKGEHIAIVGGGVLGNILAQLAMYYQCIPILIDSRKEALELAKNLGVMYTLPNDNDTPQMVAQITGDRMADSVIFASGSNQSIKNTLRICTSGGDVAIAGLFSENMTTNLATALDNQLTIHTFKSSGLNYPAAINMLANNAVDVLPLIAREQSFDEATQVLKEMASEYLNGKSIFLNLINC